MRFKKWDGPLRNMPPLHWTPRLDPGSETLNRYYSVAPVTALVSCKNGHVCALRVGPGHHTVNDVGMMNPSLGCPVRECDGHEPPGSVLEGWTHAQ